MKHFLQPAQTTVNLESPHLCPFGNDWLGIQHEALEHAQKTQPLGLFGVYLVWLFIPLNINGEYANYAYMQI